MLPPGDGCNSVTNVSVSVTDDKECMEGTGEEGRAEEVTESSEVRDGEIVRVVTLLPHPVNHPVTHEQ